MNDSIENQQDLGWLARQILERIATDPAFREELRDIPDYVESEVSATGAGGHDVSGYSKLFDYLVDGDTIRADASEDRKAYLPVARWVSVFYNMGIINFPIGSLALHGAKKQPATELPPRSGGHTPV